MKRFFLTISILLILVLPGWAATRTISDSGGTRNWTDNASWVEGSPPGNGDSVVATATSGNLTVNSGTNVLSGFDLTNYTGTLTINAYLWMGTGDLKIPDGVTLAGSTAILCAANSTVTVYAGDTIRFPEFGSGQNNVTINLGSNINGGSVEIFLSGTGSVFNTNDYNFTTDIFGSHVGTGTVTLNLGSSAITIKNQLDFASLTSLTVSANTATITISPTSASRTYYPRGVDWNGTALVINQGSGGGAPALSGTNTFKSITFNPRDAANIQSILKLYHTQTVTDGFTINGISGKPYIRTLLCSDTPGTARTIAMSGAALAMTDSDLKDITITGSPTTTNTRVGDCGNNTGAGTSTPKTVYVGALSTTRNWTTAIWSLTEEATYAARAAVVSLDNYPLPQDTLIIDDKSYTTGGFLMIGSGLSTYGRMPTIDASAYTGSRNWGFYGGTYYGSINASCANVVWNNDSAVNYLDASLGNITLTGTSTAWKSNWGIKSYGNKIILGTNITLDAADYWTLSAGTLDLNGKILTTSKTTNTSGFTIEDTAGGGKITLIGLTGTLFDGNGLTISNAPDIQIGTGALTLTADVTFAGATKTYGDLTIKKHAGDYAAIISGANTFGTVTLEAPDATPTYNTIKFPSTTTTTLTSLVADGIADHLINIQPSTAATAATLSDSGGTNTVSYCNIDYVNVEGGATWSALLTSGNTVDNATGWTTTSGATLEVTGDLVVGPVTMAGGLSRGPVFAASNLDVGPVAMAGLLHDATMSLTGDMAVGSVTMAGRLQEGDIAFSGGGLGLGMSPSGNNFSRRGYRR